MYIGCVGSYALTFSLPPYNSREASAFSYQSGREHEGLLSNRNIILHTVRKDGREMVSAFLASVIMESRCSLKATTGSDLSTVTSEAAVPAARERDDLQRES